MDPLTLRKFTASGSGANFDAARDAATPVTLYEDSHFRLYGKCFIDNSGPEMYVAVYIATKQDGAVFDSDGDELNGGLSGYLDVATLEEKREVIDESASANEGNVQYEGDTEFGATAADGYTIQGDNLIGVKFGNPPAGNGPYGPGDVCMVTTTVTHTG